jgi:hypothetical protein
VAAIFCTPTGAAATPLIQTTIYPVTGGTRWECRAWFRATTINKTTRLYLQWTDNVNAPISNSTRDLTPVAATWIWGYFSATAPSNAFGVRIAVGQIGTPAAGDTIYFDDLQLFAANDNPGIRVGASIVAGSTTLDWRTVTGVDNEWRGYAAAANGTSVYGPWAS